MADDFEPSDHFADFFFLALDHGFNSISDNEGPLVPFTLTVQADEKPTLSRHLAGDLLNSLEMARQQVASLRSKISMYAIAWDGYVTIDGHKYDAILVEAGEAGSAQAVLFCQRYGPLKKALFRRASRERIGNPALMERVPSRLL
jgi:hypothetical protein